MALHSIALTIYGEYERVSVPSHMTLLDMLREECILTGPKTGCSAGEGALVDIDR